MMIKKKKFVMDAPDPTTSGLNNKQIHNMNNPHSNEKRLGNDSSLGQLSKDPSTKMLVKSTHMGPSALKTRQPMGKEQWAQQQQESQQRQSSTPSGPKQMKEVPHY